MTRAAAGWLAVLIVAMTTVACRSTPGTYLRSRVGDVLDVVPVSLAYGRGIGASVRATPLFHVGVNAWPIRSHRFGYDDRAVCGTWREYETGVPWTLLPDDFVEKLPVSVAQLPPLPRDVADGVWSAGLPIIYRWQSARDAVQGEDLHSRGRMPDVIHLGRHPSYVRETTGALLVPQVRRRVWFREWRRTTDPAPVVRAGSAEVATGWTAVRGIDRMAPDWDRFEIDLFLGFAGARLGVRPLEFVDLAVGLFDLDLLGDDLPNPITFVPTSPVGVDVGVEALAPPPPGVEPDAGETELDALPGGPTDEAPADDTPADDTPTDDTPTDDTPTDDTPTDDTPTDDTPTDDTPTDDTPTDDTPIDDTPIDDTPIDDTPTGGVPTDEAPSETDGASVDGDARDA